MKSLDHKGFGIIESLLILVIIGIIGGTMYFVLSQNKNDTASNIVENTQENKPEETASVNTQPEGFVLPKNWTQLDCTSPEETEISKTKVLSAKETTAKDCDDRTEVVLVNLYKDDGFSKKARCYTDDEIAQAKTSKMFDDYSCEEIKVNKIKVYNTVVSDKEGTIVTYEYVKSPFMTMSYHTAEPKASLPQDVLGIFDSVK